MEMVYTNRGIKMNEYLVTAQGYPKTDKYKQTILLHDTFLAKDETDAKLLFNTKFEEEFEIIRVYSAQNLTKA